MKSEITNFFLFLIPLALLTSVVSAQTLADLNDGLGTRAYGLCQGDCDKDSDCLWGLNCFKRDGNEVVHGCDGFGSGGTDYCYKPHEGTLVIAGDEGTPVDAFPLRECFGDCDSDFDCQGTLRCFERSGLVQVPGCKGSGQSDKDYCYAPACGGSNPEACGCDEVSQADYRGTIAVTETGKTCQAWASQSPQGHDRTPENYSTSGLESNYCRNPDGEPRAWCYTIDPNTRWEYCDVTTCGDATAAPTDSPVAPTPAPTDALSLTYMGNNGSPLSAFPLGDCEGDCDDDSECAGDLLCFERDGTETVPGCNGSGSSASDYCFRHYTGYGTLDIVGDNGSPSSAFPLQVCEGDCDSDAQCAPGLVCWQRSSGDPLVPGCVGTPEAAKDYCFNPIKPTGPVAPAPTFAPVDPTPTPPGTTYRPGEKTVLMEGLSLSTGLSARKIATKNTRVQFANGGQSAEIFHSAPDGAAVFEDPATGNYVYASNSESSSDGGVGAIYFNAQGEVTGYQRLLFEDPNDSSQTSIDETSRNCGVGKTYWNTLITCEEWDGGRVWEVDPWGNTPGRVTNMVAEGRAYESAAYDNREENSPVFYITTDESNGPLVKYTPDPAVVAAAIASGDFSNVLHSGGGTYEYFVVTNGGSSGTYEWSTNLNNGNDSASVHHQNGEGIDIRDGKLYYTSKTQKLLYIIDLDGNSFTRSSTFSGVFDSQPDQVARVLDFGDGSTDGILYFCEDGGDDCGVHGRDAQGRFFTILEDGTGAFSGETTGLAFSPNGMFMYVSFQSPGIIFEISRDDGYPFYGATLDIKYHANGGPDAFVRDRMLLHHEDNAKTCEFNSEMC